MLTAVMSYGTAGGSARVRVFDWLDYLSLEANVFSYADGASNSFSEIGRKPFKHFGRELMLRRLPSRLSGSNLILSRRASPFSAGDVEERLLKEARKGIYDFDDALMHSKPNGIKSFFSDSRRWFRSVKAADVVIAGNEYLAEAATKLNSNVVVIPSCVNPDQYLVKQYYEILRDYPLAVWLGSPSTEKFLKEIEVPLLREHKRSGLRIRLISRGKQSLGMLDGIVDRVDWSLDSFSGQLADADFGLMPLLDTEWARGKCAYKLLQYGATGLPTISSPVGANKAAIDLFGAMAASDEAEWTEALKEMVESGVASRTLMGIQSRKSVQANYSFAAWSRAWLDAVC